MMRYGIGKVNRVNIPGILWYLLQGIVQPVPSTKQLRFRAFNGLGRVGNVADNESIENEFN
jgi:hypothetical protein